MENYVITIARGFGSGGRMIGMELASKLNIAYIDNEILQMASEESGIGEAFFVHADEKLHKLFFNKSVTNPIDRIITPASNKFISNENLFNYQKKIILRLAMEESCVIIGRAADYILRTFPNVVSVNIQAPVDACIDSIMHRMMVDEKEAEKLVKTTDKYRADYYRYYTGQEWDNPINYDISINSERLGRENVSDYIIQFAEKKLGKKLMKNEE